MQNWKFEFEIFKYALLDLYPTKGLPLLRPTDGSNRRQFVNASFEESIFDMFVSLVIPNILHIKLKVFKESS